MPTAQKLHLGGRVPRTLLAIVLASFVRARCAPFPANAPIVVSVTPPRENVALNGIVQWSLAIKNVTTNPWEALDISLDLTPPEGGQPYFAQIRGYHQGKDEWRVRAALRNVGKHKYKLSVQWQGQVIHSSSGSVECDASATPDPRSAGPRGFLRPRFDAPPYRTAYEDGSLFTGFGIGDCLNENLTFPTYNETSNGTFSRSLDQYAHDYGQAGFNIFRWSNGNCAWDIVKGLDGSPGRPVGNVYHEEYCYLLDQVFDTLRSEGFSMWAVIFRKKTRPPVFPHAADTNSSWHRAEQGSIERYLDFVVARWGAQVDIWSLLNEQRASHPWLSFASRYLRSIDPYRHPISSSWNDHITMSEIEVNSVHWYYSGDNRNSDADMAEQARAALAFKKPVYFTETGMIWHNWDPDSHNLMRIRSWTAFFEAANLMWWNTAGTQSYHGESGNMYLGPTERGYQRILREFVNSMTDPGVQAMNVSATEGVRAYGLMGVGKSGAGQVYMVYAHHFANHIDQIKTVLAFASGAPISSCTSTWVSPADGSVTLAAPGADGASFQSPPFAIDVALLVHCSASLPKAQEVMFFA